MEDICQSCGMPMDESQFGTYEDGSKNEEYCTFCFKDGKFTFEGTYEEFFEKQVKIAVSKMNMPEDKARKMAGSILPYLDRWSK